MTTRLSWYHTQLHQLTHHCHIICTMKCLCSRDLYFMMFARSTETTLRHSVCLRQPVPDRFPVNNSTAQRLETKHHQTTSTYRTTVNTSWFVCLVLTAQIGHIVEVWSVSQSWFVCLALTAQIGHIVEVWSVSESWFVCLALTAQIGHILEVWSVSESWFVCLALTAQIGHIVEVWSVSHRAANSSLHVSVNQTYTNISCN